MNRDSLTTLLARPGVLALALALLVALLYLPWLGHTDLVHEETRRAVIARTMMDSGEYLVPYLAERVYLSKPPLFNWLIVATSAPGGAVTEFTARLPTVLSLAVLAVTMVLTAGRRLGTPARWLLGLSVIVTGEIMNKAVLGNLDVTFTLFVSASLWVWFALDDRLPAERDWKAGLALWLPPAVLVAAAFLTKREPALVFYYLGIGGFLLTRRRFGELFRPPHLVAAAATLGLIALWLVPVIQRAGLDAVLANLDRQVLSRGLSPDLGDYIVHILRYPLELFVAALPSSLLLPALAWPSLWRAVHRRHGHLFVFAAVIVAINLPLYWLRADAAVRYFLPMFPSLVVLAALVFDTLVAERERWPRAALVTQYVLAGLLLAVTAILAGAIVVLSLPGAFAGVAGPIIPWPLMLLLGLAVLAGLAYGLLRHRRHVAVVVFVAIAAFGVTLRLTQIGFQIPHEARRIVAEHDDVPALLASIRGYLPAGIDHVQAIGEMPHAIWFYDRAGLVVPEARLERRGRPASPYLLRWTEPDDDGLQRFGLDAGFVARIPYADGDFILLRVRPGPGD